MIYILSLAPLAISLLFCLKFIFLFLKEHHQFQHLCEKTLLQAEFDALFHLKKLFQLNPKAKKLQKKEKEAKRKLNRALLTGEPLFIAESTQRLFQIQMQQSILRKKQGFYIGRANQLMRLGIEKVKKALKFKKVKNLIRLSHSENELAVKPLPPSSLSPIYKPKKNFIRKQALVLKWKLDLGILIKEEAHFLKPFLPKNLILKGQCGASIKRRDSKWTSTLIEVNAY